MRLQPIFPAVVLAFTTPASTAEVTPGGALDLTISGFMRFLWAYGDLDDKPREGIRLGDFNSNDFLTDTEVHVTLRGVHDAGLEYGGTIEFEADTAQEEANGANTDETWIFVRGGFGELRFGDLDSPAYSMAVGAQTLAVGTGGLDGDIVDMNQAVTLEFFPDAEDATKVIYYSPILAGTQLGISYAPDYRDDETVYGDNIASISRAPNDVITAALAYTGVLGQTNILGSVVSIADPHDVDDTWGVYGGAVISLHGVSLGGGVGYRRFDSNVTGDLQVDGSPSDSDPVATSNVNDFNRIFFNLGLGYRLDRYAFSVNYGRATSELGDFQDLRQEDIVIGAEVGLMPGTVVSLEVARARIDTPQGSTADDGRRQEDERRSWVGVTRLALTF